MQLLQRINAVLLKVASWGTIFFMAVMAVVIPYEVFGRYVLAMMSTWSGEVATYSLVWATMLGAAVGLKKGYQVGMVAVLEHVPPVVARLLQGLGYLFMFFFLGLMIYFGTDQTIANAAQRSPAMQIPMCYPYAALPLGFFLMLLVTLEDFLRFVRPASGKGDEA
jgi:TRAP-type C4-dicarboxylate transport system permease small subunit